MCPGAKEYLHGEGFGGKPARVRASHLLVIHSGSRRPSSWKEVRIYADASSLVLTLIAQRDPRKMPLRS